MASTSRPGTTWRDCPRARPPALPAHSDCGCGVRLCRRRLAGGRAGCLDAGVGRPEPGSRSLRIWDLRPPWSGFTSTPAGCSQALGLSTVAPMQPFGTSTAARRPTVSHPARHLLRPHLVFKRRGCLYSERYRPTTICSVAAAPDGQNVKCLRRRGVDQRRKSRPSRSLLRQPDGSRLGPIARHQGRHSAHPSRPVPAAPPRT